MHLSAFPLNEGLSTGPSFLGPKSCWLQEPIWKAILGESREEKMAQNISQGIVGILGVSLGPPDVVAGPSEY